MLFWNRREVYNGFSLDEFNRIRKILDINNIKYDMKTVNRDTAGVFDSTRGRVGTLGMNSKYSYEYYIYVRKDDYDNALYHI